MIKYEFELVLASGRIDINKLPDTEFTINKHKDINGNDYVTVELSSIDDLKAISDYANKGYFGCTGGVCSYDVVVDFECNQIIVYDDYME